MALPPRENSSALKPDSFTDDAPASDDDRYSTPIVNEISFHVDTTGFPRPMPIFGPLFGFNDKFIHRLATRRLERALRMLKRPVRDEEATAIMYWTSKNVSIMSYGGPIGIAAGAWRAYRTADTFRIPFHRPNPDTFNPSVFPAARLVLLSGPRAALTWHACRLAAYGIVGNFVGFVLGSSYALSVQTVGEATDSRLSDYIQALQKSPHVVLGMLPNGGEATESSAGMQQKPMTVSIDPRHEIDYDASPTRGGYDDADPRSADIPVTPEKRRAMDTRAYGLEGQESPPVDLDDASASDGGDIRTTGPAGGSAWGRIRQQARPRAADGGGTASSSGPREAASSGVQRARYRRRGDDQDGRRPAGHQDTMTRSDGGREEVGQTKAQEEFDARVERERQGGEFGGDPKAW